VQPTPRLNSSDEEAHRNEESGNRTKNQKKIEPIKTREKLDQLLIEHKEKVKLESAQVKIFKQKRKSKKSPKPPTVTDKTFNCSYCDKSFTKLGNLNLHLRTHTGERKYQCEQCSSLFVTSSNLQAHVKTHSGKYLFFNIMCNITA
jgi:DNA-directed RNA polymerase subunit RPC12/RpoP